MRNTLNNMGQTMKNILALLFIAAIAFKAHAASIKGKIQNEDVKSKSDIQSSVLSTTGNLNTGSACIVSIGSTTGLAAGQYVYDSTNPSDIVTNTTISGIPGTCPAGQVQMSIAAGATTTGDTITFGGSTAQLINTDRIYDIFKGQQLSSTITNGQIGSGGTTAGYVLTADGSGGTNWLASSGGFTNPMTTSGDMIYENATPAAARLPIGSANNSLIVSGGIPTWGQISLGSTAAVTGTLPVGNGGTGDSSFSANQLIVAGTGATTALQQVVGATTGYVLVSGGTTAVPYWTAGSGVTTANVSTNDGNQYHVEGFTFGGSCSGEKPSSSCTSGTCTLCLASGGVSSVTWSSTGAYLVTFTANTFTQTPICTCALSQSPDGTCESGNWSTNGLTAPSIYIQSRNAGGSAINAEPSVICFGPH